jgi:hypothetical protein
LKNLIFFKICIHCNNLSFYSGFYEALKRGSNKEKEMAAPNKSQNEDPFLNLKAIEEEVN